MFAPVRKFSSVLWLEVTGSFFTLVAIFLGTGVWKMRGNLTAPAGSHEAHRLWVFAAVFLLFSYFAVSSFVRARHRSRRG